MKILTLQQPLKKEEELACKKESKEDGEVVSDDKKKEKKLRKEKKESRRGKKNKQPVGPMHFTANNEPRALDVLGDLDPSIFNECKEKMRPVKKALKALDKPDLSLSQSEQVTHTRQCLVQIGNQINICLAEYKDPESIKEWRSNLWYFVSKFTEFDAKKLYKLYKHATKKGETGSNPVSSPEKKEDTTNSKKHGDKPHGDSKRGDKHSDKYNDNSTSAKDGSSKESRQVKRRIEEVEDNSNSGTPNKKHQSTTSTTSSTTTGSTTTISANTQLANSNNSSSSNSNSTETPRHKESKDSKHKDMKRDRERDRDRERSHGERGIDRLATTKDERVRRDSGGYSIGGGHYSGAREDDHWVLRDGRDPRDGR